MPLDHPRFFAFVPGPGNFVSAMADALVAGTNPYVTTWLEGSALAQAELVALDWLRELLCLPSTTEGLFLSGGSMANLTGLALARAAKLEGMAGRGILYCSDQAHSSVARAARLLGFGEDQLVVLRSDRAYRLEPGTVASRVAADRAAGRVPFCVVANAGTTNTGAIDPLPELGDLCRREQLWLHIDGAYGAAAALSPEGAALLAGLDGADSLTLDPHKWLFQPYEIGCLLVRDGGLLKKTFRALPEYLEAIDGAEEDVNFCDRGPELTRAARGVKLWMSFKAFGVDAFRSGITHGLSLARVAQAAVERLAGWEVVSPAQLGVVCFRCAPPGTDEDERDRLNAAIADALLQQGSAMIATTVLRERKVLRMCTINPRTTPEDIEATIALLGELARPRSRNTGQAPRADSEVIRCGERGA